MHLVAGLSVQRRNGRSPSRRQGCRGRAAGPVSGLKLLNIQTQQEKITSSSPMICSRRLAGGCELRLLYLTVSNNPTAFLLFGRRNTRAVQSCVRMDAGVRRAGRPPTLGQGCLKPTKNVCRHSTRWNRTARSLSTRSQGVR